MSVVSFKTELALLKITKPSQGYLEGEFTIDVRRLNIYNVPWKFSIEGRTKNFCACNVVIYRQDGTPYVVRKKKTLKANVIKMDLEQEVILKSLEYLFRAYHKDPTLKKYSLEIDDAWGPLIIKAKTPDTLGEYLARACISNVGVRP